ncbi:uncharacterized protein LOC121408543 [Lytechinus variegatus]|uniref:uncharacterized protein LOC121408543 n=1 Tax=Lytechinus variegatus TaxID=7654 RepID=UPI001BB1FF43|nr:uncharacterized protein LOC121408543 [Lytechinus variegatus]
MYDGFAIHEMPKQGSIRRVWVNFIQLRLKGFHANKRVHVHVCSGHFEREQYDQSQVMQYKYGYRKLPPRLIPNAVPRLHQAVQSFPDDWFVKDKGADDTGGSEDVPSKKVKHVGGNRCVLYGCSNTMYDGFAIHEMPKQGSIKRVWVNFIQLRLKGFHANKRVHVHVCSGHFEREQYDQSQVMQYKYGYRKLPPRLIPNAVPRLHQAVQSFPDDWFVKDKGADDTGGSEDVPSKKVKHVGGNRCVLYGCSNTMYDGFAIHEMPKQGSIKRVWVNFIQLRLKGFHANKRVHVHVCSGHFEREQYDQSQVMQYKYGYRKLPPRLIPNAVPRLHQAVQSFPDDWFVKKSLPPAESTPTTLTLIVASCRSSDTKTVHSTKMTVAFLRSKKASTSTEHEVKDPQPIMLADASTCMSPMLPSSGGSKRRISLFSQKSEEGMFNTNHLCLLAVLNNASD